MPNTTTRLSVNINAETEAALKDLAERHGTTVTDIVRRAVGVYKFVDDERTEGKQLQIVDQGNSSLQKLHIV